MCQSFVEDVKQAVISFCSEASELKAPQLVV